ncbi:MAG: ABC transporter permease, partial [Planctomycetota bacterium]
MAIDSFAGNVTRSIRDQSRTLLGGDLSLQARAKFPAVIDTLTDSLRTAGVPASRVTTFASMALAEPSGGTRLVQVRAVSPGYPFYGAIETVPANGWSRVHDDTLVFVDASLLIALDAKVGDRLKLGQQPFTIGGTLGNVPGDAGITAVIGPRVYVSDRWLPQMGLLSFGSRAEYELVLKLPAAQATPKPAAQVARALRRRIDPVDAARIEAAEARGERERNAPGGEGEAGARDTASAAADSAAAAPTATT